MSDEQTKVPNPSPWGRNWRGCSRDLTREDLDAAIEAFKDMEVPLTPAQYEAIIERYNRAGRPIGLIELVCDVVGHRPGDSSLMEDEADPESGLDETERDWVDDYEYCLGTGPAPGS